MSVADQRYYLAIVVLGMEPAWLALERASRDRWSEAVDVICDRHPEVTVEWFDADGLSSHHTNYITCRFNDLQAYQYLWEGLRDMELFSKPYLRIVDVIVGRSQGDRAHTRANG